MPWSESQFGRQTVLLPSEAAHSTRHTEPAGAVQVICPLLARESTWTCCARPVTNAPKMTAEAERRYRILITCVVWLLPDSCLLVAGPSRFGRTINIGHPNLFMGGAADRQQFAAAPTVNNFAAATAATTDSGWPLILISCIRLTGFPHRRARSVNDQSPQPL